MKRTVLIMAALLMAGASQSQILIGPKGGLNVSFMTHTYQDSDEQPDNPGPNLGLHLGAQIEYGLMDNIYAQPGLLYTMKGGTYKETGSYRNLAGEEIDYEDKVSIRTSYIELPINFAYEFEPFQFFMGPYFSIGLGGSKKYTRTEGNRETKIDGDVEFAKQPITPSGETYYLKGIDAGFNFGAGYRLDQMFFQLGYAAGLANIYPGLEQEPVNYERGDYKIRNGVIMASFTYWFDPGDF